MGRSFLVSAALALLQAASVHSLPAFDARMQARKGAGLDARAEHSLPTRLLAVTSTNSAPMISTIQTASTTAPPGTTGTINTGISGSSSLPPIIISSSISTPSTSIATIGSTLNPSSAAPTAPTSNNIFVPIATDAPPAQISSRADHPQPRLGIDQTGPIETNKFYANFFLGSQGQGAWTHPYSLMWAKGGGTTKSWGMSVSHTERSLFSFGAGTPASNFISPVGIQYFVLSATELGSSTVLTTDSLEPFSVNVNLAATQGADPTVSFPLVQGMGFITAIYNSGTILLQSGVFFQTLKYIGPIADGSVYKYQVMLADQSNWLIYLTSNGAAGAPSLKLVDSGNIQGPSGFSGTVQVAKNPSADSGEAAYDAAAGAYAVNATISASVSGNTGTYSLSWSKGGATSQKLLMFALPHHVESFDTTTAGAKVNISLITTTKGEATAVLADAFTMVESSLPTDITFDPWSPTAGDVKTVSASAKTAISNAGALELAQDMVAQSNLNSMYYSGKGLAKFAMIIYATNNIAGNTAVAAAGLAKLKDAYNIFVNNTQQFPLVYDSAWHGAVSSASYATGDSGVDFGNSFYNDHHFHYGYFVYAAAVIGYLDPTWLTANSGANKAWVNMLVRDFANPSTDDPHFPFQRSFDWFHGHSWAKGLFESGDGKDEESSSEDAFATYALKMWGTTIGDPNMEARANLQLAVTARSLQNYFLLQSDNTVQPPQFIGNKVTGILFENKVDHTTYFGSNASFIEGIHMIPLNPSSAYTRTKQFVQEEWDTYFSNGRVDEVGGGWRGILYSNLALIDPTTSYNWFNSPTFDASLLDGGASKTWYLAYAAGLGGAA